MFSAESGPSCYRWHVVRLRGGCETEIVLLSRRFFCLTTHFHRCTVLCCGDGCALCELLPARGLFYVACTCDGRPHLLELGSVSASHFEQHSKLLHGGMSPGQVFRLSRTGRKSPVRSEIVRVQGGASEVDSKLLCTRVMALYKYPPPNPTDTMETYEARCRVIGERRNELLAKQIVNSKSERV